MGRICANSALVINIRFNFVILVSGPTKDEISVGDSIRMTYKVKDVKVYRLFRLFYNTDSVLMFTGDSAS